MTDRDKLHELLEKKFFMKSLSLLMVYKSATPFAALRTNARKATEPMFTVHLPIQQLF